MLKRLELVGFKSFADKTVFEFGDGVTAIVGPNGSGKSNIVDAVRWILGEQSAKSLRGGEMADVIFNGSTSRRSLGLAEVTMTFDNRKRQLTIDAEEVQITRRVYRSGEGEYLINGQVCRLKDIKDMFLGSGAGNDDLCIIAQGKVDVLLQASNKDRRTIFEEAAGISRFKAKKIETLRKLERVDQNLARVKDIVDEIEKQLRSVKLQASKAQRYQEYSNRLKELRLALGLVDFGELTTRLDTQTQAFDQHKVELDQRAGRAGACEAEAERLEMFLADLDDHLHEAEGLLAKLLQQIKSEETTISHESTLTADLEAELQQTRVRLTELTVRVRLAATTKVAEAALQEALVEADRRREEVLLHEAGLQSAVARLAELQNQIATDKARHFEEMRRTAHLQNEAVSSKAQVDNLRRERDRLRQRSELAATNLASVDLELQELLQAEAQQLQRLQQSRQQLQQHKEEQEHLRQLRDRSQERISTLRQERSGLASRIDVLESLIRSHEGLGTGVREVIALIEPAEAGPWSTVIGMIADFLTVKREYAPLIDLALGDWAQRFVVRDAQKLAEALAGPPQPFSGRVSFLPYSALPSADDGSRDPLVQALKSNRLLQVSLLSRLKEPMSAPTPEHPGLVAPAEQLVSCEHPELQDLPAQLLGRTLIVRDLATARALAAHAPGFRLVTLQGELLDPDGTLTVGAHHAEGGILSRKSELREARERLAVLDVRLSETELDRQTLLEKIQALEPLLVERQEEIDVLAEQAADLRARVGRHKDRRQGLHEEVTISREEIQRIEEEVQTLEETWRQIEAQAAEAEAQVQQLHGRLRQADEEIHTREGERQQVQQAFTQAQVTFAQVEERLRGLQTQFQQTARDYRQRDQELQDNQHALANLKSRLVESQWTMLRASSVLAQTYLDKEASQRQIADMIDQRDRKRQERSRLSQQAQTARAEWRTHQETVHQLELDASNLRHQRDTLVERLRDDYQIELAELAKTSEVSKTSDVGNLAEAPAEIEELKRKLSRLGNVNMEALQELQELEGRAVALQTQSADLTSAKKSLEEIIAKINQDSQRLFMDTFAVIRTHFQELFRKLFGGGMADIVLENENDILESGIDIIARPPGKELRSISLMSGGEKTMTAVALLLAVFRSKPSPFCLLDEVDAALDEANIGRFTGVLREFSSLSQFIVVTHSKKTMAAADILYGITMQESGISKQVTIRFEDWVDENILPVEQQAQAS